MDVQMDTSGGQLQLEMGLDAVKIIEIKTEKAKLLADLTLHRSDLLLAKNCLTTLDELPSLSDDHRYTISSALWRQAVALVAKCFGKDARFRLPSEDIYAADQNLRNSLQWFIDLRNKTFIHDANAYTQRQVLVSINDGSKPNKIEKFVATNILFDVRGPENQRLLATLIDMASTWIATKFDSLRDEIMREIESKEYAELAKMPSANVRVPLPEDMSTNRR